MATTAPTVYNLTLTLADTEYSQALPTNCARYDWQCRTAFDVRYAYVTGKVKAPTAPYMTLKAGGTFTSDFVPQSIGQQTVYFASAQAGVVIEILCYPRSDS